MKVLHLEDDDQFASLVAAMLRDGGFEVQRTATLEAGARIASAQELTCAFVDLDLPDAHGLEAVMAMRRASPDLPLVVLTGHTSDTAPVKSILLGAQEWLSKHEVTTSRLLRATAVAVARRDLESDLMWRASHDELTGLANRGLVREHLTRALGRSCRDPAAVAVYFCDLDNLKVLNGDFGHAVGDAVLQRVAHRLVSAMRPGDVVGRWAGDEFVVVAEHIASVALAVRIGERMRRAVAQPVRAHGTVHRPGITVGICLADTADGAGDPIALADEAMLDAKRTGEGIRVAAVTRD